jgi:chemotaxis protein methyltransferase CheR
MTEGSASVLKSVGNHASREFPMSNQDFEFVRNMAREHTGIMLSDHKRDMVYSRLVRRIRALGLDSFRSYCKYLEDNLGSELTNFINSITTNLTSFFREPHHFEFLRNTAIPEIKKNHARDKRVRIWSAGCSTGEEPYSIAITLREAKFDRSWDVKLLATDLDTNVVQHASEGIYQFDRVTGIDQSLLDSYFDFDGDGRDKKALVKDKARELITFKQLNLLHDWPMKGKFDVIFCRNVIIYFSKDTQKVLFDRYANLLNDNGYMIIGHSESLHGVSKRFEPLGKTIYRKTH